MLLATNVKNHQKLKRKKNNGDIKSILKPITQSSIINGEMETVKDPNKFDIESVTIGHPKTVTKLSKPIKQPKIITQQPNKIKLYTESKLDLIKRHFLSKKCSQRYEIETVNFKNYDEQLNLTRSSIKNKLFEISKKLKELKFQQNLQIELTKNDEVFKDKIFADPEFDSEKLEFNDVNIDIQHNQISQRV